MRGRKSAEIKGLEQYKPFAAGPPASPELNPPEQVWEVLRDEHLANRCYEDYDAIMAACCDAWNSFVDTPARVKNLCSRSWINL